MLFQERLSFLYETKVYRNNEGEEDFKDQIIKLIVVKKIKI